MAASFVFAKPARIASSPITASTKGSGIRLDGKPFFPIMSWGQCASEVEENLTLGINVFMGSSCNEEELVKAIGGRAYFVSDYKNGNNLPSYPNLIGYYLPDEPDGYKIPFNSLPRTERVAETGRLIFETFTAQFAVSGGPLTEGEYLTFFDNLDMIGFDLYPLAYHCRSSWISLASVYDYQRRLVRLTKGKPTYQWIEVNPLEGNCGANPVSPTTVRTEAWLAIAGGATGLGYFTHAWPGGIGNWKHFDVAPEITSAVARTNNEIQNLTPVLLATQLPSIYSAPGDPIKVGGRRYQGRTYIIAVNATAKTISWSRQLPGFEKRLRERFLPHQVRIYRL